MAAHSRQISRPLVAAVCLVVLAGFPARAAEQLAFTDAPPAFTNATLATFSISWDTDKGEHGLHLLPYPWSDQPLRPARRALSHERA